MDTIDLYAFVLNRTKELRANAARIEAAYKDAEKVLGALQVEGLQYEYAEVLPGGELSISLWQSPERVDFIFIGDGDTYLWCKSGGMLCSERVGAPFSVELTKYLKG